jgi:hypothetical protein
MLVSDDAAEDGIYLPRSPLIIGLNTSMLYGSGNTSVGNAFHFLDEIYQEIG